MSSPESNKLSPNDKHELIKQNYAATIADMEATGKKFEVNHYGDVNLTLLAKIVGCSRSVFQNPESKICQQLKLDIKKLGTTLKIKDDEESVLQKQKNDANRNASKLSKELERTTAEITKLRELVTTLEQENRSLTNKLKGNEEAQNLMLDDGKRRFTWE